MKIKCGSKWLCVKTVIRMDNGIVAYWKGKVYESYWEGAITDEIPSIYHMWEDNEILLRKHFKFIPKNKGKRVRELIQSDN